MDYRDMTRKELAAKSGVPKHTIDKGIERQSDVLAVVALKISHALDIPLETLLGMKFSPSQKSKFDLNKDSRLFEKYRKTVEGLEKMRAETREKIVSLVDDVSKMK